MTPTGREEIVYPSIVFSVDKELFCVNSRYITTIMQVPNYKTLPDAPPEITGIFSYRGGLVTMLDLRRALKKKTLAEEYQEFCGMLDTRKQDHVRWVDELERVTANDEPFTLATDPHQCAFGKWFYAFESDLNEVNFHLKKIEDPHFALHQAAIQLEQCGNDGTICKKKVLAQVRQEYMPQIMSLLDETKDVFHSKVYHEMALVLSGSRKIGIVVDEVLSVEELTPAESSAASQSLQFANFVSSVQKSEKMDGLILELNVSKLIAAVDTSRLPAGKASGI